MLMSLLSLEPHQKLEIIHVSTHLDPLRIRALSHLLVPLPSDAELSKVAEKLFGRHGDTEESCIAVAVHSSDLFAGTL